MSQHVQTSDYVFPFQIRAIKDDDGGFAYHLILLTPGGVWGRYKHLGAEEHRAIVEDSTDSVHLYPVNDKRLIPGLFTTRLPAHRVFDIGTCFAFELLMKFALTIAVMAQLQESAEAAVQNIGYRIWIGATQDGELTVHDFREEFDPAQA